MTIFRKTILLISIGLLIYQIRTGWNKLTNPDLLEVKANEDFQNVDPPLIAICPSGQFQEETLQNYDYTTFTNMLNGRLLSNSNVLAWGAQENMSFVNMTNNMIDQELNVSLDTIEYFQERKFHPHLGVCWLMRPSFDGGNVMNLDFTVQLRERDTNDTEASVKDKGTDISTEESVKDNSTEESVKDNSTEESVKDNSTDNGKEDSVNDNGTDKSTDESSTYIISTVDSDNDQSLNEECKTQNAVQIFFLDGNMNTKNTFSLSAHKGDVISHSKGGVYEYEVALKLVSSSNPKNKSSCKNYLKGEYATCVDDNSQEIFMPVFGCNPPWFSPINSCTGKTNISK